VFGVKTFRLILLATETHKNSEPDTTAIKKGRNRPMTSNSASAVFVNVFVAMEVYTLELLDCSRNLIQMFVSFEMDRNIISYF